MRLSARLFTISLGAALALAVLAATEARPSTEAEGIFIEAQKALARGDNALAENLLKETLAKDPGFTSAVWQLAQIYEHDGRLDYARELLARGLSQDPQASWAREKLARIEETLSTRLLADAKDAVGAGDHSRAIPKLSSYLGMKPNDAEALALMGTCQLAAGGESAAREYFRKALALDPGNKRASEAMRSLAKRERDDRLDKLVAEAQLILLRLAPENSDSARAALGAVLAADPGNEWAKGQLADIDRFLASRRAESSRESDAPARARAAVQKSREAIGETKQALSPMVSFLIKNLVFLLLATVLAVLLIDIRRRVTRRSHPLEGTVAVIPILDIVSLLNANLRTGRLVAVNADLEGEVFFEKGEIIHARCGRLDGVKAFHALMDMRSGRYFFHTNLPRVRRTITEPLSLLLLSMRPHEEDSIVELEHEIKKETSFARSR